MTANTQIDNARLALAAGEDPTGYLVRAAEAVVDNPQWDESLDLHLLLHRLKLATQGITEAADVLNRYGDSEGVRLMLDADVQALRAVVGELAAFDGLGVGNG